MLLLGVVTYGAIAAVLSTQVVSMEIMEVLQLMTIPLFSASVVPQIMSNFRGKSTGQLALVSVALSFVGGLARIFTTLTEVPSTTSKY